MLESLAGVLIGGLIASALPFYKFRQEGKREKLLALRAIRDDFFTQQNFLLKWYLAAELPAIPDGWPETQLQTRLATDQDYKVAAGRMSGAGWTKVTTARRRFMRFEAGISDDLSQMRPLALRVYKTLEAARYELATADRQMRWLDHWVAIGVDPPVAGDPEFAGRKQPPHRLLRLLRNQPSELPDIPPKGQPDSGP